MNINIKIDERKFRPYVCGSCGAPHKLSKFSGYIGEKIDWKDDFGEPLYVGDTVKIKTPNGEPIISTVFKIKDEYGEIWGVMGFNNELNDRENLKIAKMPRQRKTKYCTLVLFEKQYKKMKEMLVKTEFYSIWGKNHNNTIGKIKEICIE